MLDLSVAVCLGLEEEGTASPSPSSLPFPSPSFPLFLSLLFFLPWFPGGLLVPRRTQKAAKSDESSSHTRAPIFRMRYREAQVWPEVSEPQVESGVPTRGAKRTEPVTQEGERTVARAVGTLI